MIDLWTGSKVRMMSEWYLNDFICVERLKGLNDESETMIDLWRGSKACMVRRVIYVWRLG
jgi:hypothetical protein